MLLRLYHKIQRINSLSRFHPPDESGWLSASIFTVSDELASSGKYEPYVLKEATEFLQERWSSLQQNIAHASSRAKAALDAAWKELTAK